MKVKGLLVALSLIIAASVFAGNEPTLFKEINRKTIVDLSDIVLEDGVSSMNVIFYLRKNKIHVLQMEGNNKKLKEKLKQKLEKIVLKDNYDEKKIYRYRFVFEQE